MKTSELIAHLRSQRIRLWVEEGELKVSAPKGALTQDLRDQLVARKAEIRDMLSPADDGGEHQAIPRSPRTGKIPLSFTQQRLWFLDQMEPGLITYNMWSTAVLQGELDVDALKEAFRLLVLRQEGIRTTFRDQGGVPVQVISDEPRFDWELFPPADGDEWCFTKDQLREMLWERQERSFDLAKGPLLRITVIPLAKGETLLFVCIHHIVSDGLSLGILFREVFEFYEAVTGKREPRLPELPIQYADFATWQRDFFEGPAFDRQMRFWRDRLSGELPLLELPADKPRPPIETHNGAVEFEWFPREVLDGLDRMVNEEQATLFVVMLAGYKAFLQRLTGQRDILVGTAMGNRTRPEVEDLVGFFTNTLVLRTDVDSELSFRDIVRRTKDTFLSAVEYQATPFEKLVDELQPDRNLAYSPIFQTFFVLDQDSGESRMMGDIEFVPFELENHATRTDLVMHSFRGRDAKGEDGLSVGLEYNTDLFEAETIQRWLQHLKTFLTALTAEPDEPMARRELLTTDEKKRLLFDWNSPRADYSALPIHAQVEARADAEGDKIALVFPGEATDGSEDERFTYRELDERANQLARQLTGAGVAPKTLVGLCLGRSAEMVVAQLAIQKTGAAYVPLDPAFPAERLSYMCEDAEVRYAVTSTEHESLLPDDVERIRIDEAADEIAAQSTERLGIEVANTDRMYVIYTSGSTGRPKGVEIEHRTVSNFLYGMAEEPGFKPGESLLAVTTLSFDISILETMLPLVVGGTVWVAPKEATVEADRLMALLERVEPEVMQATPATWRMLLVSGWEGAEGLRVLCGGEALPRELANELLPKVGELWNVYGPTEATVWSTTRKVEMEEGPVTIGHAISSTRIYILDANNQPCPVGVPGELWIAGDGLARGYLNRPELTAERFLPDSFVDEEGARMYRTGDLARWRPDGDIECLGRVDNQVKVRGYRIELGEIESVLEELDQVRQCVTVVREDTPGDQRIVAYLVGEEVDDAKLREKGGETLPSYMVPATFVWREDFPLTPNGKVDRKALVAEKLERGAAAGTGAATGVAPKNETETAIAAAWCEILGLDAVSTDVNFFDVGGHSLLLAQVRAKLQARFPGLSIIELFQNPTIGALAAHLDAKDKDDGKGPKKGGGERLASGRKALMNRRRIRG